ncbi:FAD binding domain-protein [Podospora conica]|nr:FAD binding domain-protein [Schizothecium conicum]
MSSPKYTAAFVGVALLAILAAATNNPLSTLLSKPSPPSPCRCFPGDACWPTPNEWNRFNKTLGGKLVATVPVGAVCHDSSFGPYDAARCSALRETWLLSSTHYTTTSSPMAPFFANTSCDPFTPPSAPCELGAHVHYAVNATTASDYQATLKFAREKNIRLVVRSTGHDYMGKSTGAGALALWTRYVNKIDVVDYKSKQYTGKALRVGAGAHGGDAQQVAHDAGLVVVAGNCPSVSLAGGFTQGAGLSPLSARLGLAADNVLEWEVVTAQGKRVVATPEKNEDLFWALSGGGPGTFGLVLSATVKAHAGVRASTASIGFAYGEGVEQEVFWEAVGTFLTTLPALVDRGVYVVYTLVANMFNVAPIIAPGMSPEELQTLLGPVFAKLDQSGIPYQSTLDEFPTFHEAHTKTSPDPGVLEANMGSRLIPRSVLSSTDSAADLVDAIRSLVESGLLFSGVSFNVSRFASSQTAVNPAWRSSITSGVFGSFFNRTSYEVNIADQKRVTEVYVPRLSAVTGDNAYMNEADFREPEWQKVFYGENYARLLKVKRKYDPEGMLYALTAVGSEGWEVRSDGRLCKV